MIPVCELLLDDAGHESFNSAMIYGLRLAYPDEEIIFYASHAHISAIKLQFERNNVCVKNISYIDVNVSSSLLLLRFFKSFFLIRKIISESIGRGSSRMIFLSSGGYLMPLVKRIMRSSHKNINVTFVIHGEFETISGSDIVSPNGIIGRGVISRLHESISLNGFLHTFRTVCKIVREKIFKKIESAFMDRFVYVSRDKYHAKDSIEYSKSNSYKYIVYGKHAREYAKKFIDVDSNAINFIDLPIFMKPYSGSINNNFIKFAVFGFGDMEVMCKIGKKIEEKHALKSYEIRNIGPCGIVANYIYSSTMCGPHGIFMTRDKMDYCAEDIDFFLITNGMDRYRLSTSGSILEAISHVKPIIHLDNECANYFNQPDLPIGIKCRDIEEMADKMVDIIENYEAYREKLEEFRRNILVLRDRIRVENQLEDIKAAFTFDNSEEGTGHQ